MLATVMNDLDAPRGHGSAWRGRPAFQQPVYPDAAALEAVGADLRSRPPLVFAGEVDALRSQMAAAADGRAFVLMGGDCAESFADTSATSIRLKVQTILQMAAVLTYAASTPVVKIGRMAGQYAKPRSADTETREGVTLPSYRGDSVNDHAFTPEARTPDPARMLEAYLRAGTTLNLVRAFTMGGYADLREVHLWNRGFTANPAYKRFESFAEEIDRAMRFMEAAGVDFEALRQVDFYSAHEALLLEYEDAMIRQDSRTGRLYGTSAHMLWVGERTRGPHDAHVALLEGVRNPVGVKLGPTTTPEEVSSLMDHLNPEGEPGRLSLITRMGADRIREVLPVLVEAVRRDGRPVTWITDPMHGNTITSDNGYKTRRFDTIMDEVRGFFEVHRALGTVPGGIHVELTGDDVTECLGGGEHIDEQRLAERYETLVDPRLNHQQSLEMAFEVAEMLQV
ncbi:3-deoxy-7-phosphoheptulonate synthase class II [Actinomyces sp. 2119]|uniref:Phospho-2-dehydro-3-deoxyheptonate aldolase n=1 Tax=Actinomyces lilanjuaniae TaxID=2321394 RepID=A0ABM6Z3L5_9ACTO|nr:3-deoxy-7-phosphoheptulonate synthase class II [Actinomyces lilanjuaniae]RJF44882.1 3-deoxy-7-phosphoheptulonate synthase class II [Actinomyces sp. 2119]